MYAKNGLQNDIFQKFFKLVSHQFLTKRGDIYMENIMGIQDFIEYYSHELAKTDIVNNYDHFSKSEPPAAWWFEAITFITPGSQNLNKEYWLKSLLTWPLGIKLSALSRPWGLNSHWERC